MVNATGKHRPKRRRHGEGSRPFKVDDPARLKQWRCAVRMGKDPESGRYRVKWFSGTSRVDVERQRDAFLAERDRLTAPAGGYTVAAALADYLDERRTEVDGSTWSRYEIVVRRHLEPSIGAIALTLLRHADILAARSRWGTSASSRNLGLTVLKAALALAKRNGHIGELPTEGMRASRDDEFRARYLELDEAQRLLAALAGDEIEPIVKMALVMGPRRGEVLGMQWADVDLTTGTWTTNLQLRWIHARDRIEGESPYRLLTPKNNAARGRTIVLPEAIIASLKEQAARQQAWRVAAKTWAHNDLVFTRENGNPIPPNSVTRRFQTLAERAGLGHLRFHDLRHSAATMLLAMGVGERVVQELLGHATPAQTAHYARVARSLGESAAGLIDRRFSTGN